MGEHSKRHRPYWVAKDGYRRTRERFASSPELLSGLQMVVRRLSSALITLYGDDLGLLADHYKTDKSWPHQYTQHYERHFQPFRYEPIKLVEIGVGGYDTPGCGGQSLYMWERYFPRAEIYGIDLYDKSFVDRGRVRTFRGDQTDGDFLDRTFDQIGDVEIIIDDGSHVSEHQIRSFELLFGRVREGGYYVVEDLACSYLEPYGGAPRGESSSNTAASYLKGLTDGLHHVGLQDYQPSYYDLNIKAVLFYPELVFIQKGANRRVG